MNKYTRMWLLNEKLPKIVNDAELSLIFLKLKSYLRKEYSFIESKDLTNSFCLAFLLDNFYNFSEDSRNNLMKSVISKINKGALYNFYIRTSCYELMTKEFKYLDKKLRSFVQTGLVTNAEVSDNKKIIKIILPDDTEVKYMNLDSKGNLAKASNTECFNVISGILKKTDEKASVVVVLEDREIFGKYYHCFIVKNNIVSDFAHNIVMKYEDYLRLINPKVLICEDRETVLSEISRLENEKSFEESNYVDVLKYAMNTQKKSSKK